MLENSWLIYSATLPFWYSSLDNQCQKFEWASKALLLSTMLSPLLHQWMLLSNWRCYQKPKYCENLPKWKAEALRSMIETSLGALPGKIMKKFFPMNLPWYVCRKTLRLPLLIPLTRPPLCLILLLGGCYWTARPWSHRPTYPIFSSP